ncbi:MAG TPA: hypothetical protein VF598_00105, partial [Hymenobacter sp.]
MILEISTWLTSNRDYAAGVALYVAHGSSRVIKRLVTSSCTDYTREVLERELTRLIESDPAPAPISTP